MNRDSNTYGGIVFKTRDELISSVLEVLPLERMQEDKWLLVANSLDAIYITQALAQKLHLDYDLLFCEPIMAPNNENCVVAMVSEREEIVLNTALVESFGINLDFIYAQANRNYEEKVLPKVYKYRKGEFISSLTDKNILLIDEGCETGMSAMCAAKTIINAGAKSLAYVSAVVAKDIVPTLDAVFDEMFFAQEIADFVSVAFYCKAFKQLEHNEVFDIISASKYYLPLQKNREED